MVERYGWHIKPEWIIFLPGLVCGLNLCVRACTEEHQSTLAPLPFIRRSAKRLNSPGVNTSRCR